MTTVQLSGVGRAAVSWLAHLVRGAAVDGVVGNEFDAYAPAGAGHQHLPEFLKGEHAVIKHDHEVPAFVIAFPSSSPSATMNVEQIQKRLRELSYTELERR